MIVPDVNLVVYAYNEDAPLHAPAKRWWEQSLSGREPVGLTWVVLLGFARLMSSRRVLLEPMSATEALHHCRSWLTRPNAVPLAPGPTHLDTLGHLLDRTGVGANLVTDAHVAALAIEHQACVYSNDAHFSRFPGLSWRNPLD